MHACDFSKGYYGYPVDLFYIVCIIIEEKMRGFHSLDGNRAFYWGCLCVFW